jgi:hypothetical protein
MKGLADGFQKEIGVADSYDLPNLFVSVNPGEEPIIRADERVSLGLHHEGLPWSPHLRINDGKMNRSRGERAIGISQNEGSFKYLLGWYFMGDVNQGTFGIDPQYHPFHRPDITILRAEVGHQGNDSLQADLQSGEEVPKTGREGLLCNSLFGNDRCHVLVGGYVEGGI